MDLERSAWCRIGAVILFLAAGPLGLGQTSAGTTPIWIPDPSLGNPAQHGRLYEMGRRFGDAGFDPDAQLIGEISDRHPLPSKTRHLIRESTYYAYTLLLTGDSADRARAQEVLRRVLAEQDTRPDSASEGAFLWIAEDHWENLPNPDLNSAAFVGTALAEIVALDRRQPALDPDLRAQVETACRLAVQAVIRRNVDTNYTNIALLSTGLAAAGAKLWNMPDAAAFAQSKLDTVLGLAGEGLCYEYLSPTYTAVDLYGAYFARQFAFSDAFAKQADAMIDSLWRQVARAYHPPTFQLAGPFGRAYGDNMLEYAAGLKYWLYLALDGSYPLVEVEHQHGVDEGSLAMLASLPLAARPEFKQPVPAWQEFTAIGGGQWPERRLFQYRAGNLVLGTVAFQDEWTQKRNLVAYWRSDAPAPEGFRVGFCIDESNETLPAGFHYAQISFHSHQEKDAALVALATSNQLPASGGSSFVFDLGAGVVAGDGQPLRIQDGSITAYLYPVSSDKAAHYDAQADGRVFRVTRPWSSADTVGVFHVLSYLIVFRPSDQPAPVVSGLTLNVDKEGVVSASGVVDGPRLSVSFN